MNKVTSLFRKVWGSDASRSFKLASWGVAFGAFGVWQYLENRPKLTVNSANVNTNQKSN
jgi:hypothetical protein